MKGRVAVDVLWSRLGKLLPLSAPRHWTTAASSSASGPFCRSRPSRGSFEDRSSRLLLSSTSSTVSAALVSMSATRRRLMPDKLLPLISSSRSPCNAHHPQSHEDIPVLSLRLNGNFPGGPGLADTWNVSFWILLTLRMMEVVSGNNCSYKTCKAPVISSPPTNQHPPFYMLDALPVTQPTVSEHWAEIW